MNIESYRAVIIYNRSGAEEKYCAPEKDFTSLFAGVKFSLPYKRETRKIPHLLNNLLSEMQLIFLLLERQDSTDFTCIYSCKKHLTMLIMLQ